MQENATTRTLVFRYSLSARAGQFVMLWLPEIDEKPFSIAYCDDTEFWLTICKVGRTSSAIFDLKEGDKVGLKAPLGTHYTIVPNRKYVLVAGGYGAAPMFMAAHEILDKGGEIDFIIGAKTATDLLYETKIAALGDRVKLHIATNDGSKGTKGFVTDILPEVLRQSKDFVFSCGPEPMMKAVSEIAEQHGVKSYLSAERYMKCGIGVCGQCAIDPTGLLACIDGPVMDYRTLKFSPEFGNYHRNSVGKKISQS